jgi:hypothetical protein
MTVKELLGRVDSRELSEWMAFYSLDPWGDQRADLRHGISCALFASAHTEKGKPSPKPCDFMPFAEKEEAKPDGFTGKVGASLARRTFRQGKKNGGSRNITR